jgi:formate hydrogenlyase subunit 3/multisubunit Na+/H+ antiporter MnhD subunit
MDYYGEIYLLLVTLLVFGGGVCYLVGLVNRKASGPLAALCALGAVVLAGILWRGAPAPLGFDVAFPLPAGLSAAFTFAVSPFMGALNFLAALFGFCVILYSLTYWKSDRENHRFYAFALWAVAGASVALCARHLLVFLFAWEAVTVMLYLLIGIGGPEARAGAAKTFSILGFSDVALILGIASLLALPGGAENLNIGHLQGAGRIPVDTWGHAGLYLLFLIAALAKAGAVPLHTWIPAAAEHAPIPTMALLPASLDKLLGIVLLARISLGFFSLHFGMRILLMLIGVVTIISAVMMAMVQHDLRRLLSFHAVSQVGYMVLGVGTGVPVGIAGGLFHMVNHAIYKSLLFLSGGAVESRTGESDLDNLGGLARAMPLTATGFIIGSLAISGVPPLNGFVSKWMVYQGVLEGGSYLMPVLLAAAVLGSALTLASFVKAMHSVFFGERDAALAGKDVREASWNMLLPLGLLSGLCIVLGLAGGPVATGILNAGLAEFGSAPQAVEFHQSLAFPVAFWGPVQAVALMLIGLALGLAFYAVGRGMKVRRVRPFLGGEVTMPASTHVSGTGFYLTVRELPFIRGFYGDAEREAFDAYRVAGQVGSRVVAGLSKLHTGVLEVYVTWVVVGAGAVIALMFLLR